MAISTLNEYYQSKGQALPSVSERQGIAAQAGIQNYTGSTQQNTQLLSNLIGNQGNQTAVPNTTIPAPVAVGTTTPMDLPNRPTPQEPTNLYTQAASIIANLPKTGVAGVDQMNQALAQLPGQLYEQQGISAKEKAASEAQTALKLFEEESRTLTEKMRTDITRTAASKQLAMEDIQRSRAYQTGTLAIKAAAASQDFETAMSVMKTMSDMITEPMRQTRDFFKEMYNRTEDQKFQRAMKAEDRAYQAAREDSKMLNDLKLEGLKNGISWDAMKDVKSMDDYYKIVGQEKGLSENAIDLIKTAELINTAATERTRGFRRGVGRRGLFGLRSAPEVPKAGTQVADFRSDLDRLKGLLAKDSLSTLKGTISDKDIVFLERLGTSLNYTMTEDKFNQALIQLDDTFKRNYGVGFRPTDVKDPAGLGIDTAQLDPAGILQ